MPRSIGRVLLTASLGLLLGVGTAVARKGPVQVDHTPWLGMRFVQDGKPAPLVMKGLHLTEVRLAARRFRILFPKRQADIAYQLCAWTDKSVFKNMSARSTEAEPNAGAEHPCFLPGTGMADTEAGSGMLMLDKRGNNYLIDLRLGPDPEHPAVYYSALWTRAGGSVPLTAARHPIYLVAFHDSDRDGYIGNSEYDLLVLRFNR